MVSVIDHFSMFDELQEGFAVEIVHGSDGLAADLRTENQLHCLQLCFEAGKERRSVPSCLIVHVIPDLGRTSACRETMLILDDSPGIAADSARPVSQLL